MAADVIIGSVLRENPKQLAYIVNVLALYGIRAQTWPEPDPLNYTHHNVTVPDSKEAKAKEVTRNLWGEMAGDTMPYLEHDTGPVLTPVIFRKWPKKEGGEVIALMPEQDSGYGDGSFDSYMHVGQHAPANRTVIWRTKLAKPEEYAPLLKELTQAPYFYHFKILSRIQRSRK